MTELGIPGVKTCGHKPPQFGCVCCIEQDHEAADHASFESWKKTFKGENCPGCGHTQKAYTYHRDEGKLWGVFSCNTLTKGGEFRCEDHDGMVELK